MGAAAGTRWHQPAPRPLVHMDRRRCCL